MPRPKRMRGVLNKFCSLVAHIGFEQREDMLVYVLLKDGPSANPPRPVAVEIARSSADDAFAPASVADEGTDLLDIIGGADTQ